MMKNTSFQRCCWFFPSLYSFVSLSLDIFKSLGYYEYHHCEYLHCYYYFISFGFTGISNTNVIIPTVITDDTYIINIDVMCIIFSSLLL